MIAATALEHLQTLAKAIKRSPGDPKAQAAFFAENQPLIAATGRKQHWPTACAHLALRWVLEASRRR